MHLSFFADCLNGVYSAKELLVVKTLTMNVCLSSVLIIIMLVKFEGAKIVHSCN